MSKSRALCSQRKQGTRQENSPAPESVHLYQFAIRHRNNKGTQNKSKQKLLLHPRHLVSVSLLPYSSHLFRSAILRATVLAKTQRQPRINPNARLPKLTTPTPGQGFAQQCRTDTPPLPNIMSQKRKNYGSNRFHNPPPLSS